MVGGRLVEGIRPGFQVLAITISVIKRRGCPFLAGYIHWPLDAVRDCVVTPDGISVAFDDHLIVSLVQL